MNVLLSDCLIWYQISVLTYVRNAGTTCMCTFQKNEYSFRLHEHPKYEWSPRLTDREFMTILSNLTAIRIRGTYGNHGAGYLEKFKLETAHRGSSGYPANWIETCTCPKGYVGQHCESCAPGFRHNPALGGPTSPCVPCDCNRHASICDSETGS